MNNDQAKQVQAWLMNVDNKPNLIRFAAAAVHAANTGVNLSLRPTRPTFLGRLAVLPTFIYTYLKEG